MTEFPEIASPEAHAERHLRNHPSRLLCVPELVELELIGTVVMFAYKPIRPME